ncbi:MAG: DUF1404 family protein, partial [Nitrososphaerota archaeon]|nr:DUF1404 family protein [Nitrososphaerota archaeon]
MVGAGLSITVMLVPPLYVLENMNLTVRMITEILLFVYAIMFGYALEKYASAKMAVESRKGLVSRAHHKLSLVNRSTRGLIFVLLIPSILAVYWNYPPTFDTTAQNILLRYSSDLSYLVAAILAGFAVVHVGKKLKVLLLYFAFMSVGMMGSMMLVWQPGFYTFYSAVQNTDMSTFMMMFGAFGIM